MPNDLPAIVELTQPRVYALLERFCDDPGDRNCGGFVDPATGWADSRNTIYDFQDLFAAYLYPEFSETYGSPRLLAKLRLHLDFMKRRQHPDGSVSLDARGVGGGNEVGFTLPGVCETYRRVVACDLPGRDEILERFGDYICRGAEAVRRYFPYTSNHRWTACIGPLAVADGLFPDPANGEVIEEYLSDGIDIDADGLYYEERSPNYNNVANWGLLYLVDHWGRRDFLSLIERNLRLSLAMRQPCGEAETLYSYRQDRGEKGRGWGCYYVFKRMAVETGDGVFATAADMHLSEAAAYTFVPLRYLFDDERLCAEEIPRKPLPEMAEILLRETPIWRYRNGPVASTVVADAGGHWWDVTQGDWGGKQRADSFMSLHCGEAIIDAMKICWGSGIGGFRPESIQYSGNNELSLSYRDPGWNHVAHFRPVEKWGPRHIDGLQIGNVVIHREADDVFCLKIKIGGWDDIPLNIELLLREDGFIELPDGKTTRLERGGRTFALLAGSYVLTGPDRSRITIRGVPKSEHRLFLGESRTITGNAEFRCHRLIMGVFTPLELEIRFLPTACPQPT